MVGYRYEWDEAKREANLAKHQVDFAALESFDWLGSIVVPDRRRDYGEVRLRAYGRLSGDACVVVFTRRGTVIRIISLRRANARERRRYGLGRQEDVGRE